MRGKHDGSEYGLFGMDVVRWLVVEVKVYVGGGDDA
jgi:hypothetical protein